MCSEEELEKAITTAEKLHGHLGPFLVIGVMMGRTAQRIFSDMNRETQVTVRTPLKTPFSCVIDGVQASTQCTVGNQRLKIIDSPKQISASFQTDNPTKALTLTVNSKITEYILNKLSESMSNEELAWEIALTPEERLFTVERR
jgi:formylmethanofuran dehydrogenase subunit E